MVENLCEKIFGTTDEKELMEIAEKAKKYDMIFQNEYAANLRKAGRKPRLTENDLCEITNLRKKGISINEIANQYEVTRQTISKYLKLSKESRERKFITMHMNYMFKDEICTEIDIDFKNEKIYIQNKTKDIIHQAFGVIKNPTWEEFQYFLEERCFPRTRANVKEILRDLDIPYYDPLLIIEKTQGRMAEDYQWIDITYV